MSLPEMLRPINPAELSAMLAQATAERQQIVPWGGGMHQHLGAPAHPNAQRLHTAGLNRVLEYSPADLTVTLEAGVRLADLQAVLHDQRQWLPWEPSGGAYASVGGLLAAGQTGALRLGYGAPRDWLLGALVGLGDGRLIKSGGKVVKNVAGYDSHKLQIGALGTLGVIAEVTFKVAPLPEADQTAIGHFADLASALAVAEQLRARPLAPVSMALCRGWALPGIPANTDDVLLIVRFAGVSAAVERHLRVARSLGLSDSGAAGPQIWSAVAAFNRPTDLHQIILRIGVRPAALGGLVALLGQHSPPGSAILGLPGVGLAHVGWPLIDDYAVRMAALRAAILPHAGYLVVEAASATIEAHIDRWGPAPATLGIMRSLRAQWDPAAIVNRGRFMVDSPTV